MLKKFSRMPPPGAKFGPLQRDDFLWWVDWTVSGSIALAALLLAAAAEGKPVEPEQQLLMILYGVVGYGILPQLAKALVYDKQGAFHAKWSWARVGAINLMALMALLLAISVGAEVYG
jgi:hypothetical protein